MAQVDKGLDCTPVHVTSEVTKNGRESSSSDHRNNVGVDDDEEKTEEDDDDAKTEEYDDRIVGEDDDKTEEDDDETEPDDNNDYDVKIEVKVKEEPVEEEKEEMKTKEVKINTAERIFSLPNPYYKGPNKCARGKLKLSAKSHPSSSSSSPFVAAFACLPGKGTSKKTRFAGEFNPRDYTCKIGNRDDGRKSCSSTKLLNHIINPFGPGSSSSDVVKTETMKNPFARRRSRTAPPDELTLMFIRVMDGLPPFEEEPKPEVIDDVDITSNQELSIEPNASANDDIILQEFNEKDFYDCLSDLPDEQSDDQIDTESNPCDLK